MRLQILLLAVLFAIIYEYHCDDDTTTMPSGWDYSNNYEVDDNSNDNNNYDDSYGNSASNNDSSEYRSSRQRKSPDGYGKINLYFSKPSQGGKQKKGKKFVFPVNRFNRRRAPIFGPLLSFFPWLPIFSDKLTKQTIIYSPTGGIYIIPPVINFYGQRFSIAELIASGYCSLVSSGAPPPPGINVAPLVQPGIAGGPGVPPVNTATGGFTGGVRTSLRSLAGPKYPKVLEEDEPAYEQRSGGYGY